MTAREVLRQIEKTREANFRLLHLFSLYINERADFISPEMIDEVAKIVEIFENQKSGEREVGKGTLLVISRISLYAKFFMICTHIIYLAGIL